MAENYSNREIDRMFAEIKETLNRIEIQTTKHNGRMSRMERLMLIAGTAIAVLLVLNGSSLISFVETLASK